MRKFKLPISRLRDFTRSYDKTSYRILKRDLVKELCSYPGECSGSALYGEVICWYGTDYIYVHNCDSNMMTSLNENIFRVTSPFREESTGQINDWFYCKIRITTSGRLLSKMPLIDSRLCSNPIKSHAQILQLITQPFQECNPRKPMKML